MIFSGKTVSEGVALGRIEFYRKKDADVIRAQVDDTEAEIARFEQAKEDAKREIAKIYEKALAEMGEAGAAIFEVHQMLLDDLNFVDAVTELIEKEKVSAEYAVKATCDHFSAMFEVMDNEYMQARAADVRDIGSQVIAKLRETVQAAHGEKRTVAEKCVRKQAAYGSGRPEATGGSAEEQAAYDDEKKSATVTAEESAGEPPVCANSEPVILAADELAPSELARFDRSRILALVTRSDSVNSHTAILARTMKLPALTGVEFGDNFGGRMQSDERRKFDEQTWLDSGTGLGGHMAIVDGSAGVLIVDPDEATLEKYRAKQKEETQRERLLSELRDKETVTRDGRRIRLCANIGGVDDADAALRDGADGIGLFRTEFLYLGADDFPGEEEQFEAYRVVAEKMDGRKVIIRTLDIGADKRADYFHLPHEANPALGLRGIRVSLERPDIFKIQLRAILRASCYGNVAVMYPMIISVDAARRAKQITEEVRKELDAQNIPHGEVEQGIMIETPAAVWLSKELAGEVDFFSIGTNDLTQYMLAADRQDPGLDAFYDPCHPAVLGAVRAVVENAHKSGIWAGICGELAADTSFTEEFLRMGVDELSVAPAHILDVRAAVRACTL